MTNLAIAPADAPTSAAGTSAAAALASRIEVPRRLPPRCDGEPIRHLSNSSYTLFLACPEAWRLKYLQRKTEPASGAMFLGSRVDDALSLYYRQILDHGERLDLAQVKDAYRDLWHTELQAEEQQRGVDWQDIHQHAAFELGLQALELTFEQLVPEARRTARRATPARVHARARARGVDDRLLPRPRNPRQRSERRAVRPDRRLQGQRQPDRSSRRPTATRRQAFTSPAGGSRADPLRSSPSLRSPGPAASAGR